MDKLKYEVYRNGEKLLECDLQKFEKKSGVNMKGYIGLDYFSLKIKKHYRR